MIVWLLATAWGQVLPPVTAQTLSGASVALPATVPAPRVILVLGFRQRHQADFEAWRPTTAALSQSAGVDWLELPFLDVPRFLRRIIGGAMNRSLTDPVCRAHFAPVWASADPVRAALGIDSDEDCVVVVIDAAGTVVHRVDGPPSPGSIAALTAVVTAP